MRPLHTSLIKRAVNYVRSYQLSLGIFLASYGVFFLSVVILGNWSLSDWGQDTFNCAPWVVNSLLHRSYFAPIFFLTGFPALLIGAALLAISSLRSLWSGVCVNGYVAVALVVFGFGYLVVGAWPLQSTADMPWMWQKQIMSFGAGFGWLLYLLGVVVLLIGAASLYVHSREFQRIHPDSGVLV